MKILTLVLAIATICASACSSSDRNRDPPKTDDASTQEHTGGFTVKLGGGAGASAPADYPKLYSVSEAVVYAELVTSEEAEPYTESEDGYVYSFPRRQLSLRLLSSLKSDFDSDSLELTMLTSVCPEVSPPTEYGPECGESPTTTYRHGQEVLVFLRKRDYGWSSRRTLSVDDGMVQFSDGRSPISIEDFMREIELALSEEGDAQGGEAQPVED